MKKKTVILVALVIPVLIFSALIIFRPVFITQSFIRISPLVTKDVLHSRMNFYYRYTVTPESSQIIRTENPFPSDDPNDYCDIFITFLFRNITPFSSSVHDGFIKVPDKAEFVVFKYPIYVSSFLGKFQLKVSGDSFHLICHRNGMTDEEIISKVKNLDFTIFFGTKFLNSLHMNHSLKKAEVITQEELEAIRQKYE